MKILKDSAIYLIGELFSKMIPFLLLPYLSRKLGVAGYGELSYYQTYLALLLLAVGFCQEGAISRYFYFYGKRSLNLIVNTGYLYTAVIGVIALIACWIWQSTIMAYLVIASIFQSFLSTQLVIRQCHKNAIHYTMIQFLSGILSALLTIVLLEIYQTNLVEKRILAIALANMVVFAVSYWLYVKKAIIKQFSFAKYKIAFYYIIGFGLPLILHNISNFMRGQLDRIFIYHRFSETELGLYAMGATVASIASVGIMAVNKAVIPYYFEALKKQKISLSQIHRWAMYSLLFVPIPAVMMWLIPESVVVWLLGKQFVGTKYYIMMFLISTTLSIPYLIMVNYLFYHGKNQWIAVCSTLTTVVYVLSLLGLMMTKIEYIPFAGILGAVVILPILWIATSRVEL
ncbi:oligosaccharide flippase family protein [Moraxella lacunata]|uniref:Flippase n=1 Tax=Moraxella lacunata TaxID=477 RepID=A0A1V4GU89_MORLA|nr:oligosaccharide flippase family protein [Moraxella lacunata]OPH36215.1 flippase [Moraxella lacunata]